MAKKQKSGWRTVRCVVEYRTRAGTDVSDARLARYVQVALDGHKVDSLTESRMRAKSFTATIKFIGDRRPRELVAVTRALEKVVARLRKI